MSLSLVKFFFALKVNIYLQNTSINHRLVRFDQKLVILLFFVCSLSTNIINYTCPNFQTICAMALMFTLQHEFKLSALPSIPSNGHVGGLCYSCFIIICQSFFTVTFSSRILVRPWAGFPSADIFFPKNRLHACIVKGHLRSNE